MTCIMTAALYAQTVFLGVHCRYRDTFSPCLEICPTTPKARPYPTSFGYMELAIMRSMSKSVGDRIIACFSDHQSLTVSALHRAPGRVSVFWTSHRIRIDWTDPRSMDVKCTWYTSISTEPCLPLATPPLLASPQLHVTSRSNCTTQHPAGLTFSPSPPHRPPWRRHWHDAAARRPSVSSAAVSRHPTRCRARSLRRGHRP